MARYEHLPIWRAAMDLALGLEQAAAGFPRVHRYALGAELRRSAQQVLGGVMRCARARAWAREAGQSNIAFGVLVRAGWQRAGRRERRLAGAFALNSDADTPHSLALSTPTVGVPL